MVFSLKLAGLLTTISPTKRTFYAEIAVIGAGEPWATVLHTYLVPKRNFAVPWIDVSRNKHFGKALATKSVRNLDMQCGQMKPIRQPRLSKPPSISLQTSQTWLQAVKTSNSYGEAATRTQTLKPVRSSGNLDPAIPCRLCPLLTNTSSISYKIAAVLLKSPGNWSAPMHFLWIPFAVMKLVEIINGTPQRSMFQTDQDTLSCVNWAKFFPVCSEWLSGYIIRLRPHSACPWSIGSHPYSLYGGGAGGGKIDTVMNWACTSHGPLHWRIYRNWM